MQKRQAKIVERVQALGYVSIEDLATDFKVTPQTIRRDINLLSKEGLVRRYHGGAGLATSVENIGYATRQVLCREEKQIIASRVAERIPSRASVFINIGTTTEEVARELLKKDGLRVITNNLNVAVILSQNPDIEIYMAGGVVRHRDRGITGHATLEFIRQFRTDFGIIGISGIAPNGDLLDFDYQEVQVAKAIIHNSSKVMLVADHTKFGREAMVRLGHVADIDELFTDIMPRKAMQDFLAENGVRLHT
ncbi:GlpR2 [Desulforapulum autotrophicum HRM2]|uniref:GlpR2 n=1 Tax=Desulforapulum autotrophicum (strain ATCC 43914 / DSM 3382 / VKM B-1955 / HRM2) TaxID=177437 RepID=C0QD53_DESAH|nr:DeoR family transcriptional regulator [Desulforapulum autotrophicum]ACN17285.1 GlpR2 [Desulforapulum autotrophicum HRM2]